MVVKTRLVKILLLLGVPVSLSGCVPMPKLDTSLLTDDPCAAPCWNNITPGVSNENDVRRQLENSPFVKEGSVYQGLDEQGGVPLTTFSWQSRGKPKNWIYLRDGQVLRVHINLDYDLTLGEIVDKYGSPEAVEASLRGSGELRYSVSVYYPTRGLLFSTTSYSFDPSVPDATKRFVVSEDLAMTGVLYFAPTSLRGLFSEVMLAPPDMVEYIVTNSQEWQGYGPVDLAGEYKR